MVTTTKLEAPSMSAKAKAEVTKQCAKVEEELTGWELDDHVGRPGEHLGLGQLPHHSAVMAFTIWLSELTLNPII